MELSAELEQAARNLGQILRQKYATRAYLEASQQVALDADANAFEAEMYATYEALIARQQAGEQISQDEVQAFYALRSRFFNHPLVIEREEALKPLKSLFAEVAVELSTPLGIDYTTLAQKG